MLIKLKRVFLSLLLVISLTFAPVCGTAPGVRVSAVSFSEINTPSVFLKQHTSVTCTLASAAMIMRRTAIVAELSDWEEITEANIRSKGWIEGLGLRWNFTEYDITIDHGYFSGTNNKAEMIDLLEKYPQGIVIYNGGNAGQSHAVILTDYDAKADIFYAADPASSAPAGRIMLTQTTSRGETQDEQIENLTSYWFVASPSVKLENGNFTVSGSSPGVSVPGEPPSYNKDSDTVTFNLSKKAVNAYYVVSDDNSTGAALRYYPSGSSSVVKRVQEGTILYITYTGRNNFGAEWAKTSDGYYIFGENITPFDKYSDEVVKFNNTAKKVSGTYVVSAPSSAKTALRLEPSEGNNIVGYANNAGKLYVTHSGVNSAGAQWLRIAEGYYVKASEMRFESASKQPDAVFKGEIFSVSGMYSAVPIADGEEAPDYSVKYRITASALNMRTSPVDGTILLSIPKNEIVLVTAIENGWGKIEYNGKIGWISLEYAVKEDDSSSSSKIESIKLSASMVETGQSVDCTVLTADSRSYMFRFHVYNDSGAVVYRGSSYQTKNTFSYKTTLPGTYYFAVDIIDSENHNMFAYSGNFTVCDKLQIHSIMSSVDEYSYVYEPINWTVAASNLSDSAVYVYSLYLDDELIAKKTSSEHEFVFTPEISGTYVLKVTLRDDHFSSDEVSARPVLIYDILNISSIRLGPTSMVTGEEGLCKIIATGGTGSYTYCFSVFKDGVLFKNGTFSDASSYSYSFDEPGTYAIFCSVTDSGNMLVSAMSAEITVISFIPGDADGNGKVTSSDARLVLRHSAGLQMLSASGLRACDMNGDGRVNAVDARTILRIAARLE